MARLAGMLTILTASAACAESIEQYENRYRTSTASDEGKAYETLVTAEFRADLEFLPQCARREKVTSGAITLYYEVTPDGRLGELFLAPDTVLNDCIRKALKSREFTPPGLSWVGKITLTVRR